MLTLQSEIQRISQTTVALMRLVEKYPALGELKHATAAPTARQVIVMNSEDSRRGLSVLPKDGWIRRPDAFGKYYDYVQKVEGLEVVLVQAEEVAKTEAQPVPASFFETAA